jgi:hypothetical protein
VYSPLRRERRFGGVGNYYMLGRLFLPAGEELCSLRCMYQGRSKMLWKKTKNAQGVWLCEEEEEKGR